MDESTTSPAIAVHDLRKLYDGKAAVDGLSLTVPRGCFFGFLGPNGAGKSTTIRMLVGSSRVDLQACKLEYSIVSPK